MKLNVRAIAVAVALVAATSANATSITSNAFLVVYNTSGSQAYTYTRDLGVSLASLTSATTTLDSTTNASFGADAFFSSFLQATAGDTYSYGVYDVTAAYGTTAAPGTFSTFSGQTNPNGAYNFIQAFGAATNGLAADATTFVSTGSAYHLGAANNTDTAGSAYLLQADVQSKVTSTAALGSSLEFYTALAGAKGTPNTFTQASNVFTLSSTGNLTFASAQVAAVPEPGTWALMIAGLLTVGAIARRRNAA